MDPLPADYRSLHPSRRPNVLWILVDQLRANALGCAGDPNVRTPTLDNLATNGVWFRNAVCGAPWCCPFRGALLTGRYPHQAGVTRTPQALDPAIPTVAAPFREAGYHTAYVGKWHLDGTNDRERIVPPERRGGFDYWLAYENNNNQFENYVHGSGCDEPARLDGFETDALTDLMRAHLREHVRTTADPATGDYQPFFACLSVQPPHPPFVSHPDHPKNPASLQLRRNVPPVTEIEEKARRELAGYYSMTENIDANVRRLTETLRELGIDRETYLVFFSDHGEMLGSHGKWHKMLPFEESIRIPFFVARVGGQYATPLGPNPAAINHVDIAPTSLGLCEIPVPGQMQGHDYSDLCLRKVDRQRRGRPEPPPIPRSAYLQQYSGVGRAWSFTRPWRGVVTTDGYKLACTERGEWLFFDNTADPYELANGANDNRFRQERKRCRELLADWIERTGDDFPVPEG